MLALVYIDRLIQRNNFIICSLNVHRVVVTSVMLAAKFFDDHYYNNAYYAKIGGVPCLEMNSLELEFLFLINFALFVTPTSYSKYYNELCSHAFITPSPLPERWAQTPGQGVCSTPTRMDKPHATAGNATDPDKTLHEKQKNGNATSQARETVIATQAA